MVCQRYVDCSSFSRVHGLQRERAAGSSNPVRYAQRQPTKDLGPAMPILFHIQHDPAFNLIGRAAQQQVHHELHAAKGLASPADKKPRIVTGNLNQLGVRRIVGWLGDGGYSVNTHSRQKIVHNDLGCLDKPATFRQRGPPNPGGLPANTEDARLTLTENLYFYLFAPCVELL